jgi:Tol biopolymer transport system component
VICKNCQAEVEDLPFCPHCGFRLQEQAVYPVDRDSSDGLLDKRARRRRFFRRWVMPLSLSMVIVAFGVLYLALMGFRDGMQERNLATQHQAEIHYNRGLIYLEWGQNQLAEAEFEEALRLVPNYAEAEAKRQVAQLKQTVTPSPTAQPSSTPTSVPVVHTPTPEVVLISVAQVLYEEGTAHYEQGEWQQAISTLEQLRSEDATYHADQVIEMLFESHKNYGIELEEQGNLEEAITHYDSALYLRRRDPEVETLRQRADLYMTALGVWNVDWDKVIVNLTALYALAPDYRDTADRLYQASTIAAQAMVKEEQYCAAAELYEQALKISDSDAEIVKLEDDTRHLCQVNASLPLQTPVVDGEPVGQVHVGTLVATCYDHRTNQYDICAQNAEDNVLQTWLTMAEQPAMTLDGMRLAYRSTDVAHPGLYAVYLTSTHAISDASATVVMSGVVSVTAQSPVTITTVAEAHHPTWSPDGTQVAFSQYDAAEEAWFIYIARVGSGEPPARIHQGEWPDWGQNGLLAFTTCGEENACGIHIYDPRAQTLRKVTNSAQDRAPAWSPSGREIAYMSDIGRSMNLYVVQIDSGHVRQLTRNLFTDVMPTWSPDGQRIAYVTNRDDDWTVYVLHPAFGEQNLRLAVLGAESADQLRFHLCWPTSLLRWLSTP